jgi:hypothetical protein
VLSPICWLNFLFLFLKWGFFTSLHKLHGCSYHLPATVMHGFASHPFEFWNHVTYFYSSPSSDHHNPSRHGDNQWIRNLSFLPQPQRHVSIKHSSWMTFQSRARVLSWSGHLLTSARAWVYKL